MSSGRPDLFTTSARVDALTQTQRDALTPEQIMEAMRQGKNSSVLANLEASGAIRIAGAMYDLATGAVEFFG